ncbi:MAG: ABC transporter permease, partial [Flavisolibacter sp.]
MNKTWLVIKREYLTRVKKRTFIISTILFPLLYLALIFGTSYIAAKSSKNLRVAVIDSSGYFNKAVIHESNLQDSSSRLEYFTGNPDSVINHYDKMGYDGYIVIPAT